MSSTTSHLAAADHTVIHSVYPMLGQNSQLHKPNVWRSLLDAVMDWVIIFVAAWSVFKIGRWTSLLAICVIGNRQRALGNLLHDAGHQNLSTQRCINDEIAYIFLAPPLLDSLSLYRQQHARHHAWLGNPTRDPDFITRHARTGDCWLHAYLRVLTDRTTWAGSLFGHIFSRRLASRQRIDILLWWGVFETLLSCSAGAHFALLFLSLWAVAKATIFHAVTIFREMTDHYGLEPQGILEYTRDIPDRGFVSMLVHPHHNGYHLTHHLFPRIPYHRLPRAHENLKHVPFFAEHAIICDTYLRGQHAAVAGWGAQHG